MLTSNRTAPQPQPPVMGSSTASTVPAHAAPPPPSRIRRNAAPGASCLPVGAPGAAMSFRDTHRAPCRRAAQIVSRPRTGRRGRRASRRCVMRVTRLVRWTLLQMCTPSFSKGLAYSDHSASALRRVPPSGLDPEQRDRLGGESLATPREPEPVGRRRTDVDGVLLDAQCRREPAPHLLAMGRDTRLLADHDAVRVDEEVPGGAHPRVGAGQERERIRATVALVVGRIERTDICEPRRAEQGVGEGMCDHVPVGMAYEAPRMVDRHASEDEREPVAERVRVDAETDPKPGSCHTTDANAPGSSASDSIAIAPGGVGWSLPQGPRRRWTETSPAPSAGPASFSARSPTYATSAADMPATGPTTMQGPR